MRTYIGLVVPLICMASVAAFAQTPAPASPTSPSPAAAPSSPGSGVISGLEAIQKRNAAAPDEPIYEYDIESRVNADPKVASLREQVAMFEVKYIKAQEKLAEGSPLLRKAKDEVDSVKKHLAEVQRALREQVVASTLARARENSALAGKDGVQAYAVDDMVAADPRVAEIQAQIAPIEARYQQMRATYVEGAPQLKLLQQRLDTLNEKLNQVKAVVRKDVLASPRPSAAAAGGVGALDSSAGPWTPSVPAQPVQSREELALDMPLTLDLHAEHLQAIVDQMSQSLGIAFVLDGRVVAPKGGAAQKESAEKGATDKPAKAEAFVTDGMVAATTVSGKPLREALKSVLTPMGLDYAVQPGFIWISTPKHLRHESFEILETRQYAIDAKAKLNALNVNADLPSAASGALDLLDVLRKAVPDVVSRDDGAVVSRMNYDEGAHQLTAHTTPTNHKRIQALLETLNVGGLAKLPTN